MNINKINYASWVSTNLLLSVAVSTNLHVNVTSLCTSLLVENHAALSVTCNQVHASRADRLT